MTLQLDDPSCSFFVPYPHTKHSFDPGSEKKPIGHGVQFVDPSELNVPAGHNLHSVDLVWFAYCPAGQGKQVSDAF